MRGQQVRDPSWPCFSLLQGEGYAKSPFLEHESMFPRLAFLLSEDIVLCHILGGLRLCFTITDSFFHQVSKTNSCYFFSEANREKLVKK